MGLFQNAFYFAGTLYAALYEPMLIVYFLAFVGAYAVLYHLTPSGKFNPLRRRLMFSTWEKAKEGNIFMKIEVDCTNALKYFEKYQKGDRPSITHVAVRALAECLHISRDTLNGKIIFDKFVPFDRVDVTVLVDIEGGKDLAAMTLENCDKLSIKDIHEKVKAKGTKIKAGKDEDHKQRTGPMKLLPPFVIRLVIQLVQWLAFNLGLSVKSLALKKDTFGAGTITSLGMLGVKDAYVPFTPFMNNSVIIGVGQAVDKPVVKDGKIVIAPMVNLNITMDHRFIDGAKGKKLIQAIYDVFETPEKF